MLNNSENNKKLIAVITFLLALVAYLCQHSNSLINKYNNDIILNQNQALVQLELVNGSRTDLSINSFREIIKTIYPNINFNFDCTNTNYISEYIKNLCGQLYSGKITQKEMLVMTIKNNGKDAQDAMGNFNKTVININFLINNPPRLELKVFNKSISVTYANISSLGYLVQIILTGCLFYLSVRNTETALLKVFAKSRTVSVYYKFKLMFSKLLKVMNKIFKK